EGRESDCLFRRDAADQIGVFAVPAEFPRAAVRGLHGLLRILYRSGTRSRGRSSSVNPAACLAGSGRRSASAGFCSEQGGGNGIVQRGRNATGRAHGYQFSPRTRVLAGFGPAHLLHSQSLLGRHGSLERSVLYLYGSFCDLYRAGRLALSLLQEQKRLIL